MKYILSICVLLALSIAAYGQESGAGQPDTSGARLKQLRRTAEDLEQAGKQQEAAAVRQKGDQERVALLARIESLQSEIERIQDATGGSPQIVVHLKVFEVSLTKLRRLGYNLAKLQGKSVPSPDAAKDGAAGGFSIVNDGSDAMQFFESLRKDNLAKVLAEPSLVTTSGTKAVFNTGGKILLPRPQKDGSMPLEWQQYGMQVKLTPQLQGDHTMRLSLDFQLSNLDYAHGVQVGKDTFPGLEGTDVSTSMELHDGQTVVLGGLNQVRVETTESGVPIASSIPYIGSAFKNVKEERNETTIVVLVQPEIVQPSAASSDSPATAKQPADDVRR